MIIGVKDRLPKTRQSVIRVHHVERGIDDQRLGEFVSPDIDPLIEDSGIPRQVIKNRRSIRLDREGIVPPIERVFGRQLEIVILVTIRRVRIERVVNIDEKGVEEILEGTIFL